MATHGRSSDSQYPGGQVPPGRGRPAGRPPSVWPTGAQAPVGPESAQQEPWPEPRPAPAGPAAPAAQTSALPPPEWADPAVGRRWTSSWRAQATGPRPAEQSPPWEVAAPPAAGAPAPPAPPVAGALTPPATAVTRTRGGVRATAANPIFDPVRSTAANRTLDPARTTGGLTRTTGAMRATGEIGRAHV